MLTAEHLRERMHYNAETGTFTWLNGPRKGRKAGQLKSNGYIYLRFGSSKGGKYYLAHRLAWLYMTGAWPIYGTDHINGKRSDNRWCNLREADQSLNMQNQRKARSDNTSGLLGVYHRPNNRWESKIYLNGRRTYLGVFESPERAHEAYLKAKRKLHEGCTI